MQVIPIQEQLHSLTSLPFDNVDTFTRKIIRSEIQNALIKMSKKPEHQQYPKRSSIRYNLQTQTVHIMKMWSKTITPTIIFKWKIHHTTACSVSTFQSYCYRDQVANAKRKIPLLPKSTVIKIETETIEIIEIKCKC